MSTTAQFKTSSYDISLIYNAWNRIPGGDPTIADNQYTVGQMLLDARAPTAVLERAAAPWMQPREAYEINVACLGKLDPVLVRVSTGRIGQRRF